MMPTFKALLEKHKINVADRGFETPVAGEEDAVAGEEPAVTQTIGADVVAQVNRIIERAREQVASSQQRAREYLANHQQRLARRDRVHHHRRLERQPNQQQAEEQGGGSRWPGWSSIPDYHGFDTEGQEDSNHL